jgi:ubiquinone/menaquinone biosynthesis C-methylase UbiE
MNPENPASQEVERIRQEYARRSREIAPDFYALDRPANLFARHGQERALRRALEVGGLLPLAGRRFLEVGCGSGGWLGLLTRLGAEPQRLAGIDLDGERVTQARRHFPEADLRPGDAATLPWPDDHFDAVVQSTVFSSILDAALQDQVAAEMLRVLRPGGGVIWYDFFVNNPKNPHVRGVPPRRIRTLFPGASMRAWRVTLAPPLARRVVPWSWTLATVLEGLRLFNTHTLALVRPTTTGATP